MRMKLAAILAWAIGAIIILLSAIFAWLQNA
jgi:hypothetical protein